MKLWRQKNSTEIKILESLGEGLTSQVYKAIRRHSHLGIEQMVAVKVLNSLERVQVLKNEINILSKIESQHCVRMLGWADLKEGPAILLEYLDGISLFDLCAYEQVSKELGDEILAQLQLGVKDLHSYGIGHGDLSAKNIFITTKGVVKILDFGFSGAGSRGSTFGTPQFLPLEVWRGRAFQKESDLFSLGLLREDILSHQVLELRSKEYWSERAKRVSGSNELLMENPQERSFLSISSCAERKETLSQIVRRVQNKKKALKVTTRILTCQVLVKKHFFKRSRWSLGLCFLAVFLFFTNLQPATMAALNPPLKKNLILDIRSHQWAQVHLFKKQNDRLVDLGASVYAPFKFRKLEKADYELHWISQGRSGIILVQLNQSRRILIR